MRIEENTPSEYKQMSGLWKQMERTKQSELESKVCNVGRRSVPCESPLETYVSITKKQGKADSSEVFHVLNAEYTRLSDTPVVKAYYRNKHCVTGAFLATAIGALYLTGVAFNILNKKKE